MRNSLHLSSYLGTAFGVLTALYMVLIVTTVFFATLRTQYATSAQNEEAAVGVLEDRYLTALRDVQSSDVIALGYTKPRAELFVTETEKPVLTLGTNR